MESSLRGPAALAQPAASQPQTQTRRIGPAAWSTPHRKGGEAGDTGAQVKTRIIALDGSLVKRSDPVYIHSFENQSVGLAPDREIHSETPQFRDGERQGIAAEAAVGGLGEKGREPRTAAVAKQLEGEDRGLAPAAAVGGPPEGHGPANVQDANILARLEQVLEVSMQQSTQQEKLLEAWTQWQSTQQEKLLTLLDRPEMRGPQDSERIKDNHYTWLERVMECRLDSIESKLDSLDLRCGSVFGPLWTNVPRDAARDWHTREHYPYDIKGSSKLTAVRPEEVSPYPPQESCQKPPLVSASRLFLSNAHPNYIGEPCDDSRVEISGRGRKNLDDAYVRREKSQGQVSHDSSNEAIGVDRVPTGDQIARTISTENNWFSEATQEGNPDSDGEPAEHIPSAVSAPITAFRRRSGSIPSINIVLLNRMRMRSKMIDKLWQFLEEPDSSCAATWYARVMLLLILITVTTPLLQTLDNPILARDRSLMLETLFDAVFLAEVLLRWAICPNRMGFLSNTHNMLALAVVVPLVLRFCVGFEVISTSDVSEILLLCITPVLRLLKSLRSFPNLVLVGHALSITWEALVVPLFLLMALTLIFATALYIAEPRDNIDSMPHAMYFVVITITTVGYGEITPITWWGRSICSVLAVMGVLYMAMPLSIIGSAFSETWKRRDHIILVDRLRQRILEWGYSETDLYSLFKRYDQDSSEDLNETEFWNMVRDMRLGFSEKSCMRLFCIFDEDQGGTVDFQELLDGIFVSRRGGKKADSEPEDDE